MGPPAGRREPLRILIEHRSSVVLLDLREEFAEAGFEVTTCLGPGATTEGTCPLVVGEGCELAEQADVIVNALGRHRREVFAAQRRAPIDPRPRPQDEHTNTGLGL